MGIFEGLTLESLFLVLFGVFIFVLGTTSLRAQRRAKTAGTVIEGTVIKSNYVSKRDAEDLLIQNYYELRVEYTDDGHKSHCAINSHVELHEGDKIKLIKNNAQKNSMIMYEGDTFAGFSPWNMILGGMLIAVIPMVQTKYGEQNVSFILIALLVLAGVSLTAKYIKDKNRETISIEATVTDILKTYAGKKNSKLTKQTVSYYPILQYTWNNQQTSMRSKFSSSMKTANKIGSKKILYFDKVNDCILEKGPKISMLVAGIILLLFAILGIASIVLGY